MRPYDTIYYCTLLLLKSHYSFLRLRAKVTVYVNFVPLCIQESLELLYISPFRTYSQYR